MSIHHLPVWLSRFVGRENEIAGIKNQITHTRLLTLTGPGGIGKTRLALEVARSVGDHFRDGVCFVPLASLQDGALVSQNTLFALGLSENPGQPVSDRLVDHLKSKCLLLVLDNCEHLVDACAKFAYTLLADCPDLHIMATSREPLHIAGEVTVQVQKLSLPDWQADQPVDNLLHSEAVKLFMDRVRSVFPAFEINPQNAAAAVKICRQLDGIPLALELAAARANALSLVEIAERMVGPAGWLVNPDRLAPSRQQTMQATLDWSYALLEQNEQRLFWRLAVFNGGFGLEAAEAVCAGEGIEQTEILTLLSRLVDKCLVDYKPGQDADPAGRYRMLEVVQQYAIERLKTSGEEQSLRSRHFDWCLALVGKAEFVGAERGYWITHIEQELPNLRQAFAWRKTVSEQPEQSFSLANGLSQFWQARGYLREGMAWIQSLIARPAGIPIDILAYSFGTASFLAHHMDDLALEEKCTREALALFQEIGDQHGVAREKNGLGIICMEKGDYQQAQKLIAESLAIYQKIDRGFEIAITLMSAGDLAFITGEYAQAAKYIEESIEISRNMGNLMAVARRQVRLAQIWIAMGDMAHAQRLLEACLKDNHGLGDRWTIAMILVSLANMAALQGRLPLAARCLGIIEVFLESNGTRLWVVDRLIFENQHQLVQKRMEKNAFSAALEEGRRQGVDIDRVLDYAAQLLEEDAARPELSMMDGPAGRLTPNQAAKQAYGGLTAREREIAARVARGETNAAIAEKMMLSERTVTTHVSHILTKLGYSSRSQVAAWAVEKGLVKVLK